MVEVAISLFSVGVMGLYLALHPALYREWLIALFPPIHRDLVRDVLADCGQTLRAYIVGQLLTMTFLGALTAIGLYDAARPVRADVRRVHRARAIVPFFGTLLATTLPALFVLTGAGRRHARALGRSARHRRAPDRGQHRLAATSCRKQVDLPPVLTIVFVLIVGSCSARWDCSWRCRRSR